MVKPSSASHSRSGQQSGSRVDNFAEDFQRYDDINEIIHRIHLQVQAKIIERMNDIQDRIHGYDPDMKLDMSNRNSFREISFGK